MVDLNIHDFNMTSRKDKGGGEGLIHNINKFFGHWQNRVNMLLKNPYEKPSNRVTGELKLQIEYVLPVVQV